jgi:tryptophanyl-tRNA synthetase
MLVPGTDGTKMSKSKGNIINLFLPEKQLKKQINNIETDSTPLEEPKDPDTCNAFTIYSLLANETEIEEMRANYLGGGYGYGHAKKAILDLILEKFKEERERFTYYMENKSEIETILMSGAEKARLTANNVLDRVREILGFNKLG